MALIAFIAFLSNFSFSRSRRHAWTNSGQGPLLPSPCDLIRGVFTGFGASFLSLLLDGPVVVLGGSRFCLRFCVTGFLEGARKETSTLGTGPPGRPRTIAVANGKPVGSNRAGVGTQTFVCAGPLAGKAVYPGLHSQGHPTHVVD